MATAGCRDETGSCALYRDSPQKTFFLSSAFLKLLPFVPHANESTDDRGKRQVTSHEAHAAQELK